MILLASTAVTVRAQMEEATVMQAVKEAPILSLYAQTNKKVQALVASTSMTFAEAEKIAPQLDKMDEQTKVLNQILIELRLLNRKLK